MQTNEIESGKAIAKAMTPKTGSLRRSMKEINLFLSKEKRQQTQLTNTLNERMDITADLMGTKRIIKEYY